MSATIGSVLIDLKANTAKLDEQLRQTKSHFNSLHKTIHSVRNVLVAFGAVTVLKDVLSVVAANEKAFALLKSQVKATGGAAGYSAEQLRAMAMQMEHVTTFSHTQIEQAQSELLAFTSITGEQFKKTLQVSMDFATVTGRNLPDALRTLGEAINNPVGALGRLTQAGVSLTKEQQNQIKSMAQNGNLIGAQNILLKDLATSYGGAARAARNTLGGALSGLKNTFTDLIDGGNGSFNGAIGAVNQLATTLNNPGIKQGFNVIIECLSEVVSVAAKAASGLGDFLSYVSQLVQKNQNAATEAQRNWRLNDMRRLAAKGEQNSAAYKHDEAMAIGANNYLMGAGSDYLSQPKAPQVSETVHGAATTSLSSSASSGTLYDPQMVKKLQNMRTDFQKIALMHPIKIPVKLQKLTETDSMQQFADMQKMGTQVATNLQNTFANVLFQPFHGGLRSMVRGFIMSVDQMVAKAAAAQLMGTLFGGGSSGVSGFASIFATLFGGSHAAGGTAPGGKISLVGEAGPELFMPHSSGTIIPHDQTMRALGGTTHHTVNIDARGAGPDETAKLLAMRQSILAEMRGETEYRLNRNAWMSP